MKLSRFIRRQLDSKKAKRSDGRVEFSDMSQQHETSEKHGAAPGRDQKGGEKVLSVCSIINVWMTAD